MNDAELRDSALCRFGKEFPEKFNAGMREHNPDGTKGMMRMTVPQLITAAREEVYDLMSYLEALEKKFHAAEAAMEMRNNNTKQ